LLDMCLSGFSIRLIKRCVLVMNAPSRGEWLMRTGTIRMKFTILILLN